MIDDHTLSELNQPVHVCYTGSKFRVHTQDLLLELDPEDVSIYEDWGEQSLIPDARYWQKKLLRLGVASETADTLREGSKTCLVGANREVYVPTKLVDFLSLNLPGYRLKLFDDKDSWVGVYRQDVLVGAIRPIV